MRVRAQPAARDEFHRSRDARRIVCALRPDQEGSRHLRGRLHRCRRQGVLHRRSDLKKTMPTSESYAETLLGKGDPGSAFLGLETDKPLICAVNGYALAGGTELLLACDIAIASENASFGLTEVRRGSIPWGGSIQRLPRSIAKSDAMLLLLTGDIISAQEALRIGLVSKVVPHAELMPTAMGIARRIASNAPLAVRAVKQLVVQGQDLPLRARAAYRQVHVRAVEGHRGPHRRAQGLRRKARPGVEDEMSLVAASAANMPAALEGLRVLDLSGAMGNYAGKLFADMGAAVILVEPPGGTELRREPPFIDDVPGLDRSLNFAYQNTSKRGICLDLAAASGQKLLRDLAATADLVIETAPPGWMAARGMDTRTFRARVRRLSSRASRRSDKPDPTRRCRQRISWGSPWVGCSTWAATGMPHRRRRMASRP